MILEDKTVIVSGVGDGLGGEVAKLCVRDGARVMLAARTRETLEKIAGELDPSGERVALHPTDITDAPSCEALSQATADRFGGVDAIVQVAALDSVFGGFQDVAAEDLKKCFDVNVVGTTQVTRAAVPHMKKRGGGSIVLIGSQSSFLPLTPQIAYASSKGALHTAMFFMAKELGPDRIRVNTVVPTWMWGPPVQAYVKFMAKQQGVGEEEIVAGITRGMAIPEIPADEDVAEAAVFLCSDRARMITGQSLLVNAGEIMN